MSKKEGEREKERGTSWTYASINWS